MPDSVTRGSGFPPASFTDGQSVDEQEYEELEFDEGTEHDEQETPQVNWDDPNNPYLARFKGLQGTVQTYAERMKALEAQAGLAQYQQFQAQLADMPEDQAAVMRQLYPAAMQLRQQQMTLAEKEQHLHEVARAMTIQDIATKYKVKPDDIHMFDSPEEMEHHAKALSKGQRSQSRQNRSADGADRFEGGTSPSRPPRKPAANLREAGERLKARGARLNW